MGGIELDAACQLEAALFLQQLAIFAPRAAPPARLVPRLRPVLVSGQPQLRRAAVVTLRHLCEAGTYVYPQDIHAARSFKRLGFFLFFITLITPPVNTNRFSFFFSSQVIRCYVEHMKCASRQTALMRERRVCGRRRRRGR